MARLVKIGAAIIVYISTVMAARLSLNVSVEADGILGGTAALKCLIKVTHGKVAVITWKKGKQLEDIYSEILNTIEHSGPIGSFSNRIVRADWNKTASYHTLEFENTTIADEIEYRCYVQTTKNVFKMNYTRLHLRVPLLNMPSVVDEGRKSYYPEKTCSNISVDAILEDITLKCEASASQPSSRVQWNVSQGVVYKVYNPRKQLVYVKKYGTNLLRVTREIKVQKGGTLQATYNCTVAAPGKTSTIHYEICVRLQWEDRDADILWKVIEGCLTFLFATGIVGVIVFLNVTCSDDVEWLKFNTSCSALALMLYIWAVGMMHIRYDKWYRQQMYDHGQSIPDGLYMIFVPMYVGFIGAALAIRFILNLLLPLLIKSGRQLEINIQRDICGQVFMCLRVGIIIFVAIGLGPGASDALRSRMGIRSEGNPAENSNREELTWIRNAILVFHSVMLLIGSVLVLLLYIYSEDCFHFTDMVAPCLKSSAGITASLYFFYGFLLLIYVLILLGICTHKRDKTQPASTSEASKSEGLLSASDSTN